MTSLQGFKPDRKSLRGIIAGLMLAENMGDVHDEIIFLCEVAGIPKPEGRFEDWTNADFANVGIERGYEDEE